MGMEKAVSGGLENIRFLCADAEILPSVLPPGVRRRYLHQLLRSVAESRACKAQTYAQKNDQILSPALKKRR